MVVYVIRDRETDLYLTKDGAYTVNMTKNNWFSLSEIKAFKAKNSSEILNHFLIYSMINPKFQDLNIY